VAAIFAAVGSNRMATEWRLLESGRNGKSSDADLETARAADKRVESQMIRQQTIK